jgi:tetratricopeptide (TPR) repeat protein
VTNRQVKASILLDDDVKRAILHLEESLKLWPNQTAAHRDRSIAALRQDDVKTALKHLEIERTLLDSSNTPLDPAVEADFLSRYAGALHRDGRLEEAKTATQRGLHNDPYHQSLLQQELELMNESDEHYLKRLNNLLALAMERNHARSLQFLGDRYTSLHHYNEAYQCWDALLSQRPHDVKLRGHRGVALTRLYKWKEALDDLDAALTGSEQPSVDVVTSALEILSQSKSLSEAENMYKQAIARAIATDTPPHDRAKLLCAVAEYYRLMTPVSLSPLFHACGMV